MPTVQQRGITKTQIFGVIVPLLLATVGYFIVQYIQEHIPTKIHKEVTYQVRNEVDYQIPRAMTAHLESLKEKFATADSLRDIKADLDKVNGRIDGVLEGL